MTLEEFDKRMEVVQGARTTAETIERGLYESAGVFAVDSTGNLWAYHGGYGCYATARLALAAKLAEESPP